MLENLAFLLLIALLLMGSPGPATLSLAAMGTAFGVASSLRFFGGIVLGTTTVLVIVASGISGLLLALPGAVPVLTGLGTLYILYLAARIALATPGSPNATPSMPPSFPGGLLLAIANPKAYVAIGAVYSSTEVVEGSIGADAAVKLTALFATMILVNIGWLWLGAAFGALLAAPRHRRAINVGFAVLLVGSVAIAFLF